MHIEKKRARSYVSGLRNCVGMVPFVGMWGGWWVSRFGEAAQGSLSCVVFEVPVQYPPRDV